MTDLQVTRHWAREWTTDDGMTIPAHWVYRCVGEVTPGRSFAVHFPIAADLAANVTPAVVDDLVRDLWRRHAGVTPSA